MGFRAVQLLLALSAGPSVFGARVTTDDSAPSPSPLLVDPYVSYGTSYERYAKRSKAISLAQAEHVFDEFRTKLQRCPHCSGEALQPASGGHAFSLAELGGEKLADTGLPVRLGRAVLSAMVPEPAVGACVTMTLDLTAIGIPGVQVTLSIKGEIAYSVCSECFKWSLESVFLFEYGFEALGVGLRIGFDVNGKIDIEEKPCTDAPEARYCRFLHLFVPPESRLLGSGNTKCHSDRPFEVFAAFMNYQWLRLRATASGQREFFTNSFDQRLNRFRSGMQVYPPVFQRLPEGTARVPRPRMLMASCMRAEHLQVPAGGESWSLHPFCQLEVKRGDWTERQSFRHVYGGRGARDDRGCRFNPTTHYCGEPDRCVLAGRERCVFAPAFYGEVWRTSWVVGSTSPEWNETYGFPIGEGFNMITLGVQIWNFDSSNHANRVGISENLPVHVPNDGVVRMEVPLEDGAGSVTVWLHWSTEETEGEETGLLEHPLDALTVSLAGFAGKLPRYATQVGSRLNSDKSGIDVESGIDYSSRNFQGRYLARWLSQDNRAELEQNEVDAFADSDCGTQEDSDAPLDDEGCEWSSATSRCEPADYCEQDAGHFSFVFRHCHLKEFVEVTECQSDLHSTHCCAPSGEACPDSFQQVCQTEPPSDSEEPRMECHGRGCHCTEGTCYDPVLHTCSNPRGDCRKGNPEQRQACCRDATARNLIGDTEQAGDANEGGWFSSWRAQSHGYPCASLPSQSDERVANFAFAMSQHRHESNADRDEFFAEVATSAANLFVRTVADVQAMFNVYFAHDADWDDDCYTLRPSFPVFHEFEDERHQQNLKIGPAKSEQFVTHHADREGTAGDKGRRLRDNRNPFCAWSWASGSTQPWHRAEFIKKDPPRSRDGHGHASTPRKLNATMMPQAWCELASALRNSPEGRARPFGEEHFRRGWSVNFQAACAQLMLRLEYDAGSNVSGATLRMWRRMDCESTVLGSAFLTLFPNFAVRARDMKARIGTLLEDALQCAGRITEVSRQFPSSDPRVAEYCSVSSTEIAERRNINQDEESQRRNDVRTEGLKGKAEEIILLLKEWTHELSGMDRRLVKDFKHAFEYGDRLSGLAYTAGRDTASGESAIDRVRALFNSSESLEERQELLEAHLVEKAWQQRGQQNRALFPPPASYTTTTKVEVHVLSASRDLCAVEMVPGLVVSPFLRQITGRTDQLVAGHVDGQAGEVNGKACAGGTFSPFGRLRVGLTQCTRNVMLDGDTQLETSWDISLESVLTVEDVDIADPLHLTEAFAQTPDSAAGAASIREDRPMLSAAWALAQEILTDPASLLGTVAAHDLTASITAAATNLGNKARELMRTVGSNLWSAVVEFVRLRNYRLLDINVRLVRVGNDTSTATFHAKYKTATVARSEASFFGSPISLSANVHTTWGYDLSEVLAIAYHAIQHTQSDQEFSECAQCLSSPHMVFCYDPAGESSCVRGANRCARRAIMTVFDCSAVGSDDDVRTDL